MAASFVPFGGSAVGQHSSKRNRKSRKAKARRRGVLGLGSGVGAVLVFGVGPLAGVPVARADGLDVILDPLINSILGAAADPFASVDLGGLDFGVADAAAASAVVPASDPLAALASAPDPLGALASSSDSAVLFNELVYQPIHTAEEDWITSSGG